MAANEVELLGRVLNWVELESDFETDNHVIKKGEQIVILDPIRKKIGNGNSTYNELLFDTNHNIVSVNEASTLTLYNVVPQTTFFFKRTNSGITDVIFLLDSFKDSNRGFSQCDGRIHKIFIQNTLSSSFDVELALPSVEGSSGSTLVDIGTVTIAANSCSMIEFAWFKNSTDNKICFSRIPSTGSSGSGDEVNFLVERIENTTGSQIIWNPLNQRTWTLLDITNAASTYTVTLSARAASGNTNFITNIENYVTIKNTNASAKTLVIQLETTGHKLISEGLTAVSLPAGSIYEISFIFLTRGSDTVCQVTKSNKLSEITQ